ncbi:hypothetical protein CDD83_3872 [Cordyceps sp. RAO-2017]|nr:hypothetical protein CDD83_3872 [Cordyceps sp. RAO-2017]
MAPEVYESKEYNAAAADIWSLAIIFCCMTLRRFPWKIPRMTDNSYKLFAAEPTPGHDPNRLIVASRSAANRNSWAGPDDGPGRGRDHHHQHQQQHGSPYHEGADGASASGEHAGERKEVIRGPWRILRLLPRESRHIVHRMLDLKPASRAKMDEILQEPWVADTVICQQLETGEVIAADDHTHVLEPPSSQQSQQKT